MLRRAESGSQRALVLVGGFLLATLIVGFLVGIANSNVFWGEGNQYGRVPIPGQEVLHLPEGTVLVTVAAALPGRGNETPELRLPEGLSVSISPIHGGAEPEVSEDLGSSANANDSEADTQRRVWRARIPTEGDYRVTAAGSFLGYGLNPQLWLGHEPAPIHGAMIWILAALIVLLIAVIWFGARRLWPRLRGRQPT